MQPVEVRTLLAQMVESGRVDQDIKRRLETTSAKIDGTLIEAMLEYPGPLLREVAATILGERRNPKCIPHLIQALRDKSENVRFDALMAIEKCAGLEPAGLLSALRLDRSKPKQLVARVEAWWEIVKNEF